MLEINAFKGASSPPSASFGDGFTLRRPTLNPAELYREPSDTEDINQLLTRAAADGHPMLRDLTSGIFPLRPLTRAERLIADWPLLPGHSNIHFAPQGRLVAKEGPVSQLAAQAGVLARLHSRFGFSLPHLCLHVDAASFSEEDCYRFNLPEEDAFLGANPVPRAVLIMQKIPREPLDQFLSAAAERPALLRYVSNLEIDAQRFLLGLGYAPDSFRLIRADRMEANIGFRQGVVERFAERGALEAADIICFDPVLGYADLSGFGKTIDQLFRSVPLPNVK